MQKVWKKQKQNIYCSYFSLRAIKCIRNELNKVVITVGSNNAGFWGRSPRCWRSLYSFFPQNTHFKHTLVEISASSFGPILSSDVQSSSFKPVHSFIIENSLTKCPIWRWYRVRKLVCDRPLLLCSASAVRWGHQALFVHCWAEHSTTPVRSTGVARNFDGVGPKWKQNCDVFTTFFGGIMAMSSLKRRHNWFFEVPFRHTQLEKTKFGHIT